jgi:hypothetical protein
MEHFVHRRTNEAIEKTTQRGRNGENTRHAPMQQSRSNSSGNDSRLNAQPCRYSRWLSYVTPNAQRGDATRRRHDQERTAMDAIPDKKAEKQFQEMLAALTAMPAWSEKQQLELEMAREISVEMLRIAESMRDGSTDIETCLTMLKYAKVMDFVLTTLASRRDIAPQTLRVIFKLAGLKVDEAYPG